MKHGLVKRGHPCFGEIRGVTLDGMDVTMDCKEADDIAGYVDLFVRASSGAYEMYGTGVPIERRYGEVRFEECHGHHERLNIAHPDPMVSMRFHPGSVECPACVTGPRVWIWPR